MFERFTERARQVAVLAQEEARANHHTHVTIHHLLMGLIREESGLAAQVLNDLGYVPVLTGLPTYVNEKDEVHPAPMAAQAKNALELALREALSLGHNYIGTEHILLGILRSAEVGLAQGQNIFPDTEKVREEVMRRLQGPKRAKPTKKEPERAPEPDVRQVVHNLVDISFGWVAAAQTLLEAVKR